ncbi:MAG TPA: DUF4105 domain-containing protein, partial [Rhodanobacteraceae bacterium]|nr:DUF4105 domain-containing protein [Rhodanobacteraceae bacterium]
GARGRRVTRRLGLALAFLLLFFANALAFAQEAPPEAATPPALEVSLLTIGPGPIFWERFGHNAIVIRDHEAGIEVAFNYGIFDFEQEDFLTNFARGNMRYRIAADRLSDDIEMYKEESRSITEQRLAFTPEQAAALRDFLRWNIRPENAFYRYDYYLANCSTRVRDALDKALGGAIRRGTEGRSSGYTYRMDSLRLMAADPLLMLGIDLGLGPYADRRIDYWEESFVPAVFSRALGDVRVTDASGASVPLVAGETAVAKGTIEEPPALPPDLRWPFLILGIALALALYALARARSRAARVIAAIFGLVFELFCGVGGLLLLFLWFGTAHQSAWRNENLLLLNPLCLLLIPAMATLARAVPREARVGSRVAWIVVAIAAFALFSKILPWFAQANLHWIVLFLPIHLAFALAIARERSNARIR